MNAVNVESGPQAGIQDTGPEAVVPRALPTLRDQAAALQAFHGVGTGRLEFTVEHIGDPAVGRETLMATLRAHGHEMKVSFAGGHLLSWKDGEGRDLLYLSRLSTDLPIRGGVPLVFPQLGPASPENGQPPHGFMRRSDWEGFYSVPHNDGSITFGFVLTQGRHNWEKCDFRAEQIITLRGDSFVQQLKVLNGSRSIDLPAFHSAFHTYFAVGNVEEAQVIGLEQAPYTNRVTSSSHAASGSLLRFSDSAVEGRVPLVDRIYENVGSASILAPNVGLAFEIKKSDPGLVVWTPGLERSKTMPDIDDYRQVLCVEPTSYPAQIVLRPIQAHRATQEIRYRRI